MIKQDIENIKLGPRQLLFDFEKDKSKEQTIVMDCIIDQTEKYGHIVFDEVVQYVNELHDLSDVTIIQYIFWLAKDLKIHFRIDEEILEPHKVRQILIKSKWVCTLLNRPHGVVCGHGGAKTPCCWHRLS